LTTTVFSIKLDGTRSNEKLLRSTSVSVLLTLVPSSVVPL
jgi:hypothetical protein